MVQVKPGHRNREGVPGGEKMDMAHPRLPPPVRPLGVAPGVDVLEVQTRPVGLGCAEIEWAHGPEPCLRGLGESARILPP